MIDWSNVRPSDYRMDLAWTRLIVRAEDRQDRGEFELGLYAHFAGQPIRDLAYFEVIACARLVLSVLISMRFGAARQGMRPEAVDLMRRYYAHTHYAAALPQQRTGILIPDLEAALP